MAYLGIVSSYHNGRRVYLSPSHNWTDLSVCLYVCLSVCMSVCLCVYSLECRGWHISV